MLILPAPFFLPLPPCRPPIIYPHLRFPMTCLRWLLPLISAWPPSSLNLQGPPLRFPCIPIPTTWRLAACAVDPWYLHRLPTSTTCMASRHISLFLPLDDVPLVASTPGIWMAAYPWYLHGLPSWGPTYPHFHLATTCLW